MCASEDSLRVVDIQSPKANEITAQESYLLKEVQCYDFNATGLSLREWVTVTACRAMLATRPLKSELGETELQHFTAMILHTAALGACSLGERACEKENFQLEGSHSTFLSQFSHYCHALLKQLPEGERGWDLYDLIDGRLFLSFLKRQQEITDNGFPGNIIEKAQVLWNQVINGFESVSNTIQVTVLSKSPPAMPHTQQTVHKGILAFNHPVLNDYLKDIEVDEVEPSPDRAAEVVFEDLHHWHSTKPIIDWKRPAPDFKERRRNQRQAAEIITYAASLTNSRGKVLDRETILIDTKKPQRGNSSMAKVSQKPSTLKTKQGAKKGGKMSALKAAEEVQAKKDVAKRDDMIRYWALSCEEIEKDPELVVRYIKATRFLMSRPKNEHQLLLPDVAIYACNILGRMFSACRDGVDKTSKIGKISEY